MNPTSQWSQGRSHEQALSTANQVQRLLDECQRMGDSALLCATLLSASAGCGCHDSSCSHDATLIFLTAHWRCTHRLQETSGGCECQHASRLNSKTGAAAPE